MAQYQKQPKKLVLRIIALVAVIVMAVGTLILAFF